MTDHSIMEMTKLLLSLILTVSFVLRVTDGQGEVTERVCVSYITSVHILSSSWLCPQWSNLPQWLYCVED